MHSAIEASASVAALVWYSRLSIDPPQRLTLACWLAPLPKDISIKHRLLPHLLSNSPSPAFLLSLLFLCYILLSFLSTFPSLQPLSSFLPQSPPLSLPLWLPLVSCCLLFIFTLSFHIFSTSFQLLWAPWSLSSPLPAPSLLCTSGKARPGRLLGFWVVSIAFVERKAWQSHLCCLLSGSSIWGGCGCWRNKCSIRGLGVRLEGTRTEFKRNACESESERRARRWNGAVGNRCLTWRQ